MIEVDRPDRRLRRQRGTDDITDAEGAARSVIAGKATGIPKSADGNVEMIRVLRLARRSALRAKIATINQFNALVMSAPDELREAFEGLTTMAKVRKAAALRPGRRIGTVETATKLALKKLARRYLELVDEPTSSTRASHRSSNRRPQGSWPRHQSATTRRGRPV